MGTCLIARSGYPELTPMDPSLEEDSLLRIDFGKLQTLPSQSGVVPCVAQDVDTGRVLMLAYVNQQALEETLARRTAVFWSTSRDRLWVKGSTSGDYLDLIEVRVNCEQNSLLYLVRPRQSGVCHTRDATGAHRDSCYYRVLEDGHLVHRPISAPWLS
ncbi:MAG: hypothetical protein RL648_477 [Verrucomicrobiota bacterium]